MRELTITIVDDLKKYNERYPRLQTRESNIIIHDGWQWHFSRPKDKEQLDSLCKTLGVKYELVKETENWKEFKTNTMYQSMSFRKIEDIPKGAKKIKGLSNGSIVDCYYINESSVLTVFRPNPNDEDIYKPMDIEEHLDYQRNNAVI